MNDLKAISEILGDLIKAAEEIDENLLADILAQAKHEADEAITQRTSDTDPE